MLPIYQTLVLLKQELAQPLNSLRNPPFKSGRETDRQVDRPQLLLFIHLAQIGEAKYEVFFWPQNSLNSIWCNTKIGATVPS